MHNLIFVVGTVILGLIAGILFQDDIWKTCYVAVVYLVVGIPFLIIVAILMLIYPKKLRFGSWSRHLVLVISALSLFAVTMVISMCLINRWKIGAVEAYVVRAVPVLDRIKAQTGGYPSRLPVKIIGEPPSLLRDYGTYTATATVFCFEYVNEPAGWAGGEGALKFDSSTRRWSADRGDQK